MTIRHTIAAVTLALATLANATAIAATRPANPVPSDKREAVTARQRACAAEWKAAKADEAVKAAGWPKYWSACNARLKTATPAAN